MNSNNTLDFKGFGNNLYMRNNEGSLVMGLDNYNQNNLFQVAPNHELHSAMKRLFNELKSVDEMRHMDGNRFEWVSESMGVPEAQSKLVIREAKDIYFIEFFKSKFDTLSSNDTCEIRFKETDGSDPKVSKAFYDMYKYLLMRQVQEEIKEDSHLK